MQNLKYKILFLTLVFSLSFLQTSHSQGNKETINKADSLFVQKKFTQSFDIYQELLEKHQVSSPSMLLKMAFIKEGLGNYTEALYYLNLYYKKTDNELALGKIEELAKKHDLSGHRPSDYDTMYTFIEKNTFGTTIFLLAGSLLLSSLVFYQNRRKRKIWVPAALQGLLLLVIFYLVNFVPDHKRGIILNPNTYIMDGPSSGAELIEVVSSGHLVRILEDKDVWSKVEWKGRPAYIKESHLRLID